MEFVFPVARAFGSVRRPRACVAHIATRARGRRARVVRIRARVYA